MHAAQTPRRPPDAQRLDHRLTRRIAGRFVPFAAIAFSAIANERETRALAVDAIKF